MLDVIAKVIEENVVDGAFLFILYHVLYKQDKVLNSFSVELKRSSKALSDISKTLISFDSRLQKLEDKGGDKDAS